MAKFGHPDQHAHMMKGVEAAAKSPNTPAHLRAHLQKRLGKQKPSNEKLPQSKPIAANPMVAKLDPFFGE